MIQLATFVWNVDPIVFHLPDFLGGRGIRYYGVIFALTLMGGYFLWRWQMKRAKYTPKVIDDFILWGVAAVIVGARLGHCFFYHAADYMQDPCRILYFWDGGLASHGATVGLIVALFFFARRKELRPLELMDRFSMAAALGAAGIRLGNFLNSEIVGRVTDVSWAVAFPRYRAARDNLPLEEALKLAEPRHPSQLYEFGMGLTVLLLLVLMDRIAGREKRPLGLMTGLFLVLYFCGRFTVEFFKEYHVSSLRDQAGLTMGQMLSILPVLVGIVLIIRALKKVANDHVREGNLD